MTPWLILLAVAASALSGGLGYWHGRNVEQGAQAKTDLTQLAQASAEAESLRKAVNALALDAEAKRASKATKDRIIIKEVVRYETLVASDRRCMLDGAWRVLHDAAATGQPASTAHLAPNAADPTADATALDTVAENYADCRGWREQVKGWQEFWGKVSHAPPVSQPPRASP